MNATKILDRRAFFNSRLRAAWIGLPVVCVLVLGLSSGVAMAQVPLGTTFTYQGQLKTSAGPVNGDFDFEFNLYDDPDPLAGTLLGTVTMFDVPVSNGLFTVELDFGDVFSGESQWLEVGVRPAGIGPLTFLFPLQRLSPAPYALHARSATAAQSAPGVVPIGSIVAWHRDLPYTPSLPDGWVECNGQTLNDSDSPLDGQTIPDLNGEGRFLRGGPSSGLLEDDQFEAHDHGPGSYYGTHAEYPGSWVLGGVPRDRAPNFWSIVYPTHAIHGTSGVTGHAETRPVNMSVVWIMRVK